MTTRLLLLPLAFGLLANADPNDPDPALIPPQIRAMLEAAIASGNETDITTVVKYARNAVPEAADAEYLPALRGRMEFRAVTVKEPGTGRNLLDNVTFAVPAESRVAVVGPDPAAKRALVYLIPRFLDPNSGAIRTTSS